ncbi:MAG: hypothetical protein ABR591_16215, partial [Candidatus Velthaea sp.]
MTGVVSVGEVEQLSEVRALIAQGRRFGVLTPHQIESALGDLGLDERELEIEVTQQSPMMLDMMIPQGAPEGMDNLSEMLQEMLPKRKKRRSVKVPEARRILLTE